MQGARVLLQRFSNRVLKCDAIKMKFLKLGDFFWKNNIQQAYLPKMSISRQIVSEMLAGYAQKTPYKPF